MKTIFLRTVCVPSKRNLIQMNQEYREVAASEPKNDRDEEGDKIGDEKEICADGIGVQTGRPEMLRGNQ